MSVYLLLYSLLWYVLCPIILIRLFWRSRQNSAYRQHWQQRLGYIKLDKKPRIWLHAVSVGETVAAKPLVDALISRYPTHQILVTNTTPTGLETSVRLYGDSVEHSYFPYDAPHMVSRFLKRANPDLLVIMETEIWPNLISACNNHNVPTLIANARLSQRSTKGYARLSKLIAPVLKKVSHIACRSEQDIENFITIGANPNSLGMAGNIKFDILNNQNTDTKPALKEQLASSCLVWVAASTHKGEDEIILDCYATLKQQFPSLILILAPRHPERFNDVYTLCSQTPFTTDRRSENKVFSTNTEIILGDSLGEMAYWYAAADVVFVGGTLVETGGHNPLEASVFGVPVVTGPAVFNFEDVFKILTEADVAWVEHSPKQLTERLSSLLTLDIEDKNALKQRAIKTLETNQGATQLIMEQVEQLLP
ncbi:lipid IV(A) 3-deoxy-D-manno-octulosonic acid transferase [Leucothrix arctica]|uniref:3-deoxy-D-manno-octulosonic acid transferase n=1 Tax=Leucothrix arctica TaxID=1481894 RepID=A0A317CQW2_9GAMM|nr:lipid IV(A) 3-deoxy-D-manno-octulosonic acid transferase [Leucothrix arctica]PWQ98800.1 3-deoxy-D-manno-octulosonic acid transferase [Leucothrix arctica]